METYHILIILAYATILVIFYVSVFKRIKALTRRHKTQMGIGTEIKIGYCKTGFYLKIIVFIEFVISCFLVLSLI